MANGQSPGTRRFTLEAARTVAGYHLLVGLDAWSEDPGAMVVHIIDIWPDRWPHPEWSPRNRPISDGSTAR